MDTDISVLETYGLDLDYMGSFYLFSKYLLTVHSVAQHQESREKADTVAVLKTFACIGRQTLIKHKHTCINWDKSCGGKGHRVLWEEVTGI